MLPSHASRDSLYGDSPTQGTAFRFHCETLYSRSSLHRFEIGLHQHDAFIQFLYISAGEGDATLDGKLQPIRTPAVIVVPPSFEHGFRFSRDIGGLIVTALHSTLSTSAQALLRSHIARPVLLALNDHAERATIDAAFQRIAHEHAHAESGWDVLCEGQITSLVAMLARMMPSPNHGPALDSATRRFENLLALVASHIRETPPSSFYAERLGVSQTQLNRLVRQKSGMSLHQLIADRQIELAQQELLFTVSPVRLIATGLGFTDPAYFSRFFLRQTGTTPHRWREEQRHKLSKSQAPLTRF